MARETIAGLKAEHEARIDRICDAHNAHINRIGDAHEKKIVDLQVQLRMAEARLEETRSNLDMLHDKLITALTSH